MSFILDALRKSDAERQRTVTPGLADARYAARRSRRNIWLPILALVLAANVVFMSVQWFGRSSEHPAPVAPTPDPSTTAQPTIGPAAGPEVAPTPAADIRPLAREAEFGEPFLEPSVDDAFAAAPVVEEAAEQTSSVPEPGPAPAPSPPTPRILPSDDLPTIEQLIGSGALNIPMLNLDLHVYSAKPSGRFVVINSRKYKEGGQLTEGPTVERITSDGVVLTNQGRRFTLSRK